MPATIFEFGEFRLDCGRFALLREGRSLRLERKPLELLILLAEKNGQLATREEIAKRLWQSEVFVDTEHGINTAIRKIRYALRDDAEEARYIQTVTGKGYRLLAAVQVLPEVEPKQLRAAENGSVPGGKAEGPVPPPGAEQESDAAFEPTAQTRHGIRRRLWIAAGTLAAVAAVAAAAYGVVRWSNLRSQAATISSLAVLPLDNLSGDPSQEYLADGMTDELTTMLARDSTLRITSRTSVMQYKGARKPLKQIAQALGVDGVVEGSVARSGDHMHLTLQLIRVATDSHVWAESYDRDRNDVALPDEAARSIAKRLNSAAATGAPARYVNPAAHDAYLAGKYLWFNSGFLESRKYFQRAIEIQPDYAMGWAWLSNYYGKAGIGGYFDPRSTLKPMSETAERALQLDPNLAESHLAMAATLFFARWDFAGGDREILRAISLDPNSAELYHLRAKMLVALSRNQEAIENEKKGMELDAFARPWALTGTYTATRKYDAAIEDCQLRLRDFPESPGLLDFMTLLFWRKGMDKEALDYAARFNRAIGHPEAVADLRRAYQAGGYKGYVRWELKVFSDEAKGQYVSPVDLAALHAELGEREASLALLEEGFQQRAPNILFLQTNPAFDFLHTDPRYRSLVQRVGLPPAH